MANNTSSEENQATDQTEKKKPKYSLKFKTFFIKQSRFFIPILFLALLYLLYTYTNVYAYAKKDLLLSSVIVAMLGAILMYVYRRRVIEIPDDLTNFSRPEFEIPVGEIALNKDQIDELQDEKAKSIEAWEKKQRDLIKQREAALRLQDKLERYRPLYRTMQKLGTLLFLIGILVFVPVGIWRLWNIHYGKIILVGILTLGIVGFMLDPKNESKNKVIQITTASVVGILLCIVLYYVDRDTKDTPLTKKGVKEIQTETQREEKEVLSAPKVSEKKTPNSPKVIVVDNTDLIKQKADQLQSNFNERIAEVEKRAKTREDSLRNELAQLKKMKASDTSKSKEVIIKREIVYVKSKERTSTTTTAKVPRYFKGYNPRVVYVGRGNPWGTTKRSDQSDWANAVNRMTVTVDRNRFSQGKIKPFRQMEKRCK